MPSKLKDSKGCADISTATTTLTTPHAAPSLIPWGLLPFLPPLPFLLANPTQTDSLTNSPVTEPVPYPIVTWSHKS